MKKLICARDIEELSAQGEKTCYIDRDTIVTPSARDTAYAMGINITEHKTKVEGTSGIPEFEGLEDEKIFQVMKLLVERGLLGDIFKSYESEQHTNGLKVVRGNTVQMDVFETGNPDAKAYYQELVSKEEAHISAGFLTIDHSEFEWELSYEEIDYIIEGTLTVTIDGKTFTAHPGDVLFVPAGSKVIWGSPNKAKVFYATYPANWADLA